MDCIQIEAAFVKIWKPLEQTAVRRQTVLRTAKKTNVFPPSKITIIYRHLNKTPLSKTKTEIQLWKTTFQLRPIEKPKI